MIEDLKVEKCFWKDISHEKTDETDYLLEWFILQIQ